MKNYEIKKEGNIIIVESNEDFSNIDLIDLFEDFYEYTTDLEKFILLTISPYQDGIKPISEMSDFFDNKNEFETFKNKSESLLENKMAGDIAVYDYVATRAHFEAMGKEFDFIESEINIEDDNTVIFFNYTDALNYAKNWNL